MSFGIRNKMTEQFLILCLASATGKKYQNILDSMIALGSKLFLVEQKHIAVNEFIGKQIKPTLSTSGLSEFVHISVSLNFIY